MTELIRPMLAAPTKQADLQTLRFPMLASTKIDGVRAVCIRGSDGKPRLVSRTLKNIPNRYTQSLFAREEFIGLDGELVVGRPNDKNLMQQTTSGCMSEHGEPDVTWWVFDKWDEDTYYVQRAAIARERVSNSLGPVRWVPHVHIKNLNDLETLEDAWVKDGYEGMMLRDPLGPYKQNRSTLKEGYLLKVKRFADAEAVVLGFTELEANDNEATIDERGFTKRTTNKENKRGLDTLGALLVKDVKSGVEFSVGSGFSAEARVNLWEGRKYLIGKTITYKHFAVGVKDKPRFPVFKCFRDKLDI